MRWSARRTSAKNRVCRRGGPLATSLILAGVVLASCAPADSAAPPSAFRSPPATASPELGLTWVKAPDVERPAALFPMASDPTTGPAGPGTAGHPGHFPGQAVLSGVASGGGRLVAVGYGGLRGNWSAMAWTSSDGIAWRTAIIDSAVGSFAEAVLFADSGAFIAVGRSGSTAMSWSSDDGQHWIGHRISADPVDMPERATAIAADGSELVVGGSAGPELGSRTARFWYSGDGSTWLPAQAAPPIGAAAARDAFTGAETSAILRTGDGFVALGRLGTGQRSSGSVAWLSADGRTWQRVDDPALEGGLAVALVSGAVGLVAVGSDADEREAVTWVSPDGSSWTRSPREESRLHGGEKIRMTDVARFGGTLIAVGNYVGVQYGQGVSWTTIDGQTWQRAPDLPVWGQGEPSAVIAAGPGLVSVGTFGAPDNYIPTVWLSPALP